LEQTHPLPSTIILLAGTLHHPIDTPNTINPDISNYEHPSPNTEQLVNASPIATCFELQYLLYKLRQPLHMNGHEKLGGQILNQPYGRSPVINPHCIFMPLAPYSTTNTVGLDASRPSYIYL
jgi:hypothetical protein